ncbi:MAG: hypothetical protein LBR84_07620 [Tannerella sp.]|jgi:3-oxoacyl-(acyl-carrier-protein) synthase|nr:hypothetical protein [Tannerella sp.]
MFVTSTKQISAQNPLSDSWFDDPVYYVDKRVPTVDPDFSAYLSPIASRRMCSLLKRAVVISRLTLQDAGIEMPDAIISGTGLGCIGNTEKFIWSIMKNGEQCLQPTFFMQSTHNVLSTTVAIDLKCYGYNNTFVHRGVSFENALMDADLQFGNKKIRNILVGGYEELNDDYYVFFDRLGIWDFADGPSSKNRCFAGEASVCMLLSSEKTDRTLCEINDVELMYRPSIGQMRTILDAMLKKAGIALTDIDAVVTGISSHPANDAVYGEVVPALFGDLPVMQYKHLFGESFSSNALGTYVAMTCLHKGRIPAFLLKERDADLNTAKHILVYNHYQNKSHSFILLSSCSS